MATDETRNPYVILGVPPGADRRRANTAFARAQLQQRAGEIPWSLEDLTWALHQIENIELHSDEGHYRVPADPDAILPPLSSLLPLAKRNGASKYER